jgi:two-component system alkaline phosphatase synthesis response regulator PhoP
LWLVFLGAVMSSRICIFGSDQSEGEDVKSFLIEKGFNVTLFHEVKDSTVNQLIDIEPRLVLLDVEINNADGIDFCNQLKQESEINSFVVFFTKHEEEYVQVEAYKAGADDYIIKPISPRLLAKRIQALLRRSRTIESPPRIKGIKHNKLKIDRESYSVIKGKSRYSLPRKEFEILFLLANHPKKTFTREEILSQVWNDSNKKNTRVIDVHIRKIRERIGQKIIKTIKGVGYQLA